MNRIKIFIIFIILIVIYYQLITYSSQQDQSNTVQSASIICNKNQIKFLGKCFCKSGYDGANCNVEIMKVDQCKCPGGSKLQSDPSWKHSEGPICTKLCHFTPQSGIFESIPDLWQGNQIDVQVQYYKNQFKEFIDSKQYKLNNSTNHMAQRFYEIAEGYDFFEFLNNTNLGSVIEYGCGPVTQLHNILQYNSGIKITDVTLVDPLIDVWSQLEGCPYANGKLNNLRTTLVKATTEEYGKRFFQKQYDTVIEINVLVYAKNALDFLDTLYNSLKIGGLLIFQERIFDDSHLDVDCVFWHKLNIIQIRYPLLAHFLSHFSLEPFISTKESPGQKERFRKFGKCQKDLTYWTVLRKIK